MCTSNDPNTSKQIIMMDILMPSVVCAYEYEQQQHAPLNSGNYHLEISILTYRNIVPFNLSFLTLNMNIHLLLICYFAADFDLIVPPDTSLPTYVCMYVCPIIVECLFVDNICTIKCNYIIRLLIAHVRYIYSFCTVIFYSAYIQYIGVCMTVRSQVHLFVFVCMFACMLPNEIEQLP